MSELMTGGNDPMTRPDPDPKPAATPAAVKEGQGEKNDAAPKVSTEDSMKAALARLKKGEKPTDINAKLFGKKDATPGQEDANDEQNGDGKDATASRAAPKPKGSTGKDQPAKTAIEADSNRWGLNAKELNALKRGKIDVAEEHWNATPPSTMKAIARQMVESQANADREFQKNRQGGKNAQGGQQPATIEGEQPEPAASDDDTPADDELGNQAPEQEQTPPPAKKPVVKQGQPLKLQDQTRQTIAEIGGDRLADGVQNAVNEATGHFMAQVETRAQAMIEERMAPVNRVVQGLLQIIETQHFDRGMEQLSDLPGYGQLDDSQKQQIRTKAEHLLRASDAPLSQYNLANATVDAARVLFQPNSQQAARKSQNDRARDVLRAQPEKGNTRSQGQAKPLSGAQLTTAVHTLAKRENISFAEARQRLDQQTDSTA